MLRIRLFHGEGATPESIEAALSSFGFDVSAIGIGNLAELSSDETEVLYLPGGWYRFDSKINSAIGRFVRGGGACVGTCAGSYLVAGDLNLIPSRVLRPNIRGRVYLEPQQCTHPILRGVVQPCRRHHHRPHGEPLAMTHLGGPFLLPEDKDSVVLSYDFEGEIGALLAAEVGEGRAVAIASHPELDVSALPSGDTVDRAAHSVDKLPQGDVRLLMRNAVLWAARREELID